MSNAPAPEKKDGKLSLVEQLHQECGPNGVTRLANEAADAIEHEATAAAYWKGAYDRMTARNIEAAVEVERLTARDAEMAAECNRLTDAAESTALELTKALFANDLLRRQVSDLENKDHARTDAAIARATEGV